MPSKNKVRAWLFAILTALGVGGYQAAQMLGCDSGMIDDKSGECVEFDK
jgi:hypothetical protein